MHLALVGLTVLSALDAPVTQVTVFTDQARVVRTAQVQVAGALTLELPVLRDTVDPGSIRVEAQGAEVRRVDIERLSPEKMRTDEAKAVIAELEKVDTELMRLNGERSVLFEQKAALERLSPTAPTGDPLKAPPRLNGAGWTQSAAFATAELAKLQTKLRDGQQQLEKLGEKRDLLVEKAQKLGQPLTATGWKVTAQLAGNGPATVTLTYLVRQARWTPTWDLQLLPDTNMVQLSLAGLVSQDSGEDWNQATLLLSTAIPSAAVRAPKLTTWKIGVMDRFIPTPTPVVDYVQPPPAVPAPMAVRSEEDVLRGQLARITGYSSPPATLPELSKADDSRRARMDYDERLVAKDKAKKRAERPAAAPPPPPPPSPSYAPAPSAAPGRAYRSSVQVAEESEASEMDFDSQEVTGALAGKREQAAPVAAFSLSPPPAWRMPSYGADSPVTLAGGYDLAFTSLQKESVPTARGTRRVALWSNQWPVKVERKIFPALAPEAYLVAELKNPSAQVLPGGPAQLYVGADPAGTARLKLVSPGEAFTLPLGLDRALKAVRNVKVVESTTGVISKDEVNTYTVTIEIANPYRAPVALRVYDQWPVTDQKDLEVKLIESKPLAIQDALKGALEWRATIPAQQKATFAFTYSLKRPRGWKLQQQEVQP